MKLHNLKGFTLVETMIALGLTGIISVALMTNMKSIQSSSKQSKQENIISATTKMVQAIMSKAERTAGSLNEKNCGEILTPGGVLAGALAPGLFVGNQNLGDGVTLVSIDITQEPTNDNRIPVTLTLNYTKNDSGRVTNVERKVQTSVVNDNGTYRCINYDGLKVNNEAFTASCSIIDPDGDCSFADFTPQFKASLNKIICETLGATNAAFVGNTTCNQIAIERELHGKNVSLTGNRIIAEDEICVGAQCRQKFDNTPCDDDMFVNSMSIDGKTKGCALPVFSPLAPIVATPPGNCPAGTQSGCSLPATAAGVNGASGTCSTGPANSCSANCSASSTWGSIVTTNCNPPTPINGVCNNSTNNSCTAGTLNDIADDATNYYWECFGINGGSNASCSMAKVVPPPPPPVTNGACNNSVTNSCSAGTLNDTADDSLSYHWQCVGANGGTTASCSKTKPVDYCVANPGACWWEPQGTEVGNPNNCSWNWTDCDELNKPRICTVSPCPGICDPAPTECVKKPTPPTCTNGDTRQIEAVGTMCACPAATPYMCNPRVNQTCNSGTWTETSCTNGGCAAQSCN